ncbi:MAG: transglycosylase SLT domain-containing protein [Proteobacteria bacterium]|nr:transglycosylase SLT domain-containing protein [Pseudomonadota bacterium]
MFLARFSVMITAAILAVAVVTSSSHGAESEPPSGATNIFESDGRFARVFGGWHDTMLAGRSVETSTLRKLVPEAAERYNLEPALLMAVIRNSSGFDPAAVAESGAVGLMGLEPDVGGRLALNFLGQGNEVPSPERLRDPKINIALGSAYIHLLLTRDFKDIKNRLSRRYAAVAAYHGGTAHVVRAISGERDLNDAVRRMNRLKPAAIYRRLMRQLPFKETKLFLDEVTLDMARWDQLVLADRLQRVRRVTIPRAADLETPPALVQKSPAAPSLEVAVAPPVGKPPSARRIKYFSRASRPFRDSVLKFARHYKIKPSLILAMIKNESAFDPVAVSRAGALGLMQLVPQTGGREALSFLRGKTAIPERALLFTPDNNIQLGSTYLHLLLTRHLGAIKNETSRRYAAIAAYNTGLGNLARAIGGKRGVGDAIEIINSMSPNQFYGVLLRKLPYGETKAYLARVNRDIQLFTDLDDVG